MQDASCTPCVCQNVTPQLWWTLILHEFRNCRVINTYVLTCVKTSLMFDNDWLWKLFQRLNLWNIVTPYFVTVIFHKTSAGALQLVMKTNWPHSSPWKSILIQNRYVETCVAEKLRKVSQWTPSMKTLSEIECTHQTMILSARTRSSIVWRILH